MYEKPSAKKADPSDRLKMPNLHLSSVVSIKSTSISKGQKGLQ